MTLKEPANETTPDHISNRNKVVLALRREMMGPSCAGEPIDCSPEIVCKNTDEFYGPNVQSGSRNEIIKWESPRKHYGVGVLYPAGPTLEIDEDPDELGQYLWIGTENGLCKFNIKEETFISEYNNKHRILCDINHIIMTILRDHQGVIWIGTWGEGLIKFNPKTQEIKYYKSTNNSQKGLPNNIVMSIFEDSKNNLWIGTRGGGLCKGSSGDLPCRGRSGLRGGGEGGFTFPNSAVTLIDLSPF